MVADDPPPLGIPSPTWNSLRAVTTSRAFRCRKKVSYPTRELAQSAADSIAVVFGKRAWPYDCTRNNLPLHFHVTSRGLMPVGCPMQCPCGCHVAAKYHPHVGSKCPGLALRQPIIASDSSVIPSWHHGGLSEG